MLNEQKHVAVLFHELFVARLKAEMLISDKTLLTFPH